MIKRKIQQWEKLSSKIIYKGQYAILREDKVIRPDGKEHAYAFLQVPRTVGIVPVNNNYEIFLCKQFRYIFQKESWEIPRGFVDDKETYEEAAGKELEEEAGVITKNLISMGSLRLSGGMMDEEAHIFLAMDVVPSSRRSQENAWEIHRVKRFSMEEVSTMISLNEIDDGLTVGAIFKTKELLKKRL